MINLYINLLKINTSTKIILKEKYHQKCFRINTCFILLQIIVFYIFFFTEKYFLLSIFYFFWLVGKILVLFALFQNIKAIKYIIFSIVIVNIINILYISVFLYTKKKIISIGNNYDDTMISLIEDIFHLNPTDEKLRKEYINVFFTFIKLLLYLIMCIIYVFLEDYINYVTYDRCCILIMKNVNKENTKQNKQVNDK